MTIVSHPPSDPIHLKSNGFLHGGCHSRVDLLNIQCIFRINSKCKTESEILKKRVGDTPEHWVTTGVTCEQAGMSGAIIFGFSNTASGQAVRTEEK